MTWHQHSRQWDVCEAADDTPLRWSLPALLSLWKKFPPPFPARRAFPACTICFSREPMSASFLASCWSREHTSPFKATNAASRVCKKVERIREQDPSMLIRQGAGFNSAIRAQVLSNHVRNGEIQGDLYHSVEISTTKSCPRLEPTCLHSHTVSRQSAYFTTGHCL